MGRNGHRPTAPQFDVATPDTIDPRLLAMQAEIDQARAAATPAITGSSSFLAEIDDTQTSARPEWADELVHWWASTATSDIESSIDKIVAYGGAGAAYDLIATGRDLAAMNGRDVGDEEATELGILFYVSSKLHRLMAAAIDGRRGSDDSVLDAAFYLMMMRRNRAVGGWPVKPA